MARFGTLPTRPPLAPTSLGPAAQPVATHQGGSGYTPSDPRVELFNAAASGLLADQFYEQADDRLARLVALVPQCPPAWLAQFVPWLRTEAHLRSAPLVIAAEYVRAGFPIGRAVVASALQRADEPGEAIAYWRTQYGRALPMPYKRGIADACVRLYDENAAIRYDGKGKAWRLGDVLEVVHPKPKAAWQSELFKLLLDRRRHDAPVPVMLKRLADIEAAFALPPDERTASAMPEGISWEMASTWMGKLDAAAWERLVPTIGFMALLRNLNNIRAAGVSAATLGAVCARLADPDAVRRSGVLPFRFLTAYKAKEFDAFRVALSDAADASVASLPAFNGTTLIMVDCSGSMNDAVGAGKSRMPLRLADLAGLFAESIAERCESAWIAPYTTEVHELRRFAGHGELLRRAADRRYTPGGGTNTWTSTAAAYTEVDMLDRRPDRVIIITDEQTSDGDDGYVTCPVITWNLGGYQPHHAKHGAKNRHFVAGYTDSVLQMLPAFLGFGATGRWPWER